VAFLAIARTAASFRGVYILGLILLLTNLVALAAVYLANSRYSHTPDGVFDVGVLFAHGMTEQGELSQLSEERLARAYALLKDGKIKRLICSGGARPGQPTVADLMCSSLKERGIAEQRLAIESCSFDSLSNIQYSFDLLRRDERSVLFISSQAHASRLLWLSSDRSYAISFAPADTMNTKDFDLWSILNQTQHEVLSYGSYLLLGPVRAQRIIRSLRWGNQEHPERCVRAATSS
jgi:vancomycin permeability regulator SanA